MTSSSPQTGSDVSLQTQSVEQGQGPSHEIATFLTMNGKYYDKFISTNLLQLYFSDRPVYISDEEFIISQSWTNAANCSLSKVEENIVWMRS